jgi:hypothetical protein
LTDLDCRFVVDGGCSHTLLDLSGHGEKSLFDVGGVLRRGFEERNADAVCELLYSVSLVLPRTYGLSYLGNSVLNRSLIGHVALISDQQLVDAFGGVSIDLLKPLLDIVERVHVSHIVDDTNAVGASVVGGCDGTEALLTGGVPLHKVRSWKRIQWLVQRTIWSLTVLPSSSIVRIFCGCCQYSK